MKLKLCVIIVIGFVLFTCCSFNRCENIDSWRNDAPKAFQEFEMVKREIISKKEFQNEFSNQGILFLRILDTSKYRSYDMPYLKEWFRNGRGYISFSENDTSLCFKECECGRYTATGTIHYGRKTGKYKSSVQLIDSLYLGNGWFAHIVKCTGCND